MSHEEYDAEVRAALRRLEMFATFTPFSRSFYRLLHHMLPKCGTAPPEADKFRRAFLVLLRLDLRRHEAFSSDPGGEAFDILRLVRTTREARDKIRRLVRGVMALPSRGPQERVIQSLLLAECYYLLGETRLVLAELRRALAMGCDHPVVHFAFGYNLYCHAMRAYTRVDAARKQATATDPVRFVGACRQAIAAFRAGLGHPELDAHMHWWIGFLSEILAETGEARREDQAAARLDPQHFAQPARERLARLSVRILDAEDPGERQRLAQLPPISDEDLREAARVLTNLREFPKFFEASDRGGEA